MENHKKHEPIKYKRKIHQRNHNHHLKHNFHKNLDSHKKYEKEHTNLNFNKNGKNN